MSFKGYKTALYHNDLPPVRKDDGAVYIYERFAKEWQKELNAYKVSYIVFYITSELAFMNLSHIQAFIIVLA